MAQHEVFAAEVVTPIVGELVQAIEEMALHLPAEEFDQLSQQSKDITLKVMQFMLMMRLGLFDVFVTFVDADADADVDTDTDKNR